MKRLAINLFIVANSLIIAGCSWPIKPSTPPGPSPLVVASCPKLTPLTDDTFGGVVAKLTEVAGTYYGCRAAAGVE